jgi:hypothetical protein
MIIVSLRFLPKIAPNDDRFRNEIMRLFFHEKLNLSDNHSNRKLTIAIQLAGSLQSLGRPSPPRPSRAPSTALCPLYGHVMSPLWPVTPLKPSAPYTALCPPPRYTISSMAL